MAKPSKPTELAVLPKDFVGPPTAKQSFNAAPGELHKADVDGDGTTTPSFERASSDRRIVSNAGSEARKAALAAKKKKSKEEIQKDVNAAKKAARAQVASATPEEKAAALKEWKQGVIDALHKASAGDTYRTGNTLGADQATAFHNAADALEGKLPGTTSWVDQAPSADDQLGNLLNGKVSAEHLGAFGGTDAGYNHLKRPMWNYLYRQGLAYEGDWQIETSVSYINKAGEKTFTDASTEAYFVADGKKVPAGTWAQITAPNGVTRFAQARDLNGKKADPYGELSAGLWKQLGYADAAPDSVPLPEGNDRVKVKIFPGSAGAPPYDKYGNLSYEDSHFTPEETQQAGQLLADGKVKSIGTRADLYRAQGKEPPAETATDPEKWKTKEEWKKQREEAKAKEQGGKKKATSKDKKKVAGLLLLDGYPTVMIGPEMRLVGYANVACLHEGGGYVNQGSGTVFVGKFPFSRIGDGTSDALAVVAGADTVFAGGPATGVA